jgi:hypothetical protein
MQFILRGSRGWVETLPKKYIYLLIIYSYDTPHTTNPPGNVRKPSG